MNIKMEMDWKSSPPREIGPTTYLVQRLLKRPDGESCGMLDRLQLAFGGGTLGLSEVAQKVANSIFRFDHMGAAEYEFGAVRETLAYIAATRADYAAWHFVIHGHTVKPAWWRKYGIDRLRNEELVQAKASGTKPPRMTAKHKASLAARLGAAPQDRTIYVVSHGAIDRALVQRLIIRVGDGEVITKGGARFDLDPEPGRMKAMAGWLDLDNNLAWFADKDTFERFVATFEIGHRPAEAVAP